MVVVAGVMMMVMVMAMTTMMMVAALAVDHNDNYSTCSMSSGAFDLVFGRVAQQTTHDSELCVLGHSVIVINNGEEDDRMNDNFALGGGCGGHCVDAGE